MKLTVALIVGVALVLAAAMFLESVNGPEYARWYVYKNPWFAVLLGILALNVLAALMVRFPWRRGHRGVLLIHVGLLVFLAGAIVTFATGIEGQLALVEGESGDTLLMTDCSQLTTAWKGHENQLPEWFNFEPGPTDWPEGTTLVLDRKGSVQLEVLKFYRHARADEQWMEDPTLAAARPSNLRWPVPTES